MDTVISKNKILETTLLPQPDKPEYPGWYHISRAKDYSEKKLIEYTEKFFENVINEYKILVEINFPTIKEHFSLYKQFPVYVMAQLETTGRTKELDGIMYAFLKNSKHENEIEVRGVNDKFINTDHSPDEYGFRFETKNGILHTSTYTDAINDFLFTANNDSSPFQDCPVTAMVYDLIKDDLKSVYGEKYDVSF